MDSRNEKNEKEDLKGYLDWPHGLHNVLVVQGGDGYDDDDGFPASTRSAAPGRAPAAASLRPSLCDKLQEKWGQKISETPQRSPEASSNMLSLVLLEWAVPLTIAGIGRTLNMNDMWVLEPQDEVTALSEQFWKNHAQGYSIVKNMFLIIRRPFVISGLLAVFHVLVLCTLPLLLRELITMIAQGNRLSLVLALVLTVLFLGEGASTNYSKFMTIRIGMRLRLLAQAIIYQRTLEVSGAVRTELGLGNLTNMLASDCLALREAFTHIHVVWTTPLQLMLMIPIMALTFGYPAVAGLLVQVCQPPITYGFMLLIKHYRTGMMPAKDERVAFLSETLQGIKLVRCNGWSDSFFGKIQSLRDAEFSYVPKQLLLAATMFSIADLSSLWAQAVAVGIMGATGQTITTADFFGMFIFFGSIHNALFLLGHAATMVSGALVTLRRLDVFLAKTSANVPRLSVPPMSDGDGTPSILSFPSAVPDEKGTLINISMGSFMWNYGYTGFHIAGIDLRIRRGQLVGVVGPVGSGKSMLLQSILGETAKVTGSLVVNGAVAYAAQTPFLIAQSVRDNILFGLPYDPDFYSQVVEASGLAGDIAAWASGDSFQAGENGQSLSGGQKARVGLARALYSRRPIMLFDDPLSGLDATTKRKVFSEAIGPGSITADKGRIMVTQSCMSWSTRLHFLPASGGWVQHLPQCNWIVVMSEGRIVAAGTFAELEMAKQSNAQLQAILGSIPSGEEDNLDVTEDIKEQPGLEASYSSTELTPTASESSEESSNAEGVTWRVYLKYFQAAGGNWALAVILATNVALRATFLCFDYYTALGLSTMGQGAESAGAASVVSIFAANLVGWVVLVSVLNFVRDYTLVILCSLAARNLFERMLATFKNATMLFYQTHSIGQLLNRFTFDVDIVDLKVSKDLARYIPLYFTIFSVILVIGINTPESLALVLPVMVIFMSACILGKRALLQSQRLEAESRSHIQTQFTETWHGMATIRTYNQQAMFTQKYLHVVNRNGGALFATTSIKYWLVNHIGILAKCIVGVVAFVACLLPEDAAKAGLAGLALLRAWQLAFVAYEFGAASAHNDALMISVERMLQYIETVEQETSQTSYDGGGKSSFVDDVWPSAGALSINNVYLHYRPDLPPALSGVTAHIRPGEHVGIVGKTGAGKSTLTAAIFRLAELSSGTISVDDVNLGHVALRDVRGRAVCLMAQESVMFSGTVRSNLDLFNEFDDQTLWDILRKVRMHNNISGLGGQLEHEVRPQGVNFSAGQRQLLCLARVLLKRPRILVLDESTASIDHATEAIVKEAIRETLPSSTVVEIAHRLHTVVEADRILVMAAGKSVDFDTPIALMNKPDSLLAKLVESTGAETASELRNMALAAEQRRLQNANHSIGALLPKTKQKQTGLSETSAAAPTLPADSIEVKSQ